MVAITKTFPLWAQNDLCCRCAIKPKQQTNNKTFPQELGPGGTKLPTSLYRSIPWKHPNKNKTIRELLVAVFGTDVLATSSMTGKASNAMALNKPAKKALDRMRLDDVIRKYIPFICAMSVPSIPSISFVHPVSRIVYSSQQNKKNAMSMSTQCAKCSNLLTFRCL